jgi:hypothetical protein
MQEELHRNPNYGVASVQYAPVVADILKQVGAPELLDYGAGKGRLGETLKTLMPNPPQIRHYDPVGNPVKTGCPVGGTREFKEARPPVQISATLAQPPSWMPPSP